MSNFNFLYQVLVKTSLVFRLNILIMFANICLKKIKLFVIRHLPHKNIYQVFEPDHLVIKHAKLTD